MGTALGKSGHMVTLLLVMLIIGEGNFGGQGLEVGGGLSIYGMFTISDT